MDEKIGDEKIVNDKIESIFRLTTYSREEIKEKLEKYDGDSNLVIREYMGLNKKKETNKIKNNQLNQEIYRQIRRTLDAGMREYREKNPINIDEAINNLRESEEREREKEKLKNKNE